jgi:glycosyltransferase involved in cell wall biosynthesis
MPVYNEEKDLGETIKKIKESFKLDFYSKAGAAIKEKLIQVVDDGSTDNSVSVAKSAGADIIVSYKPNRKLAYCFKRSVESCLENGADLMVNIDADGQFDPNDIPKLLTPILEGNYDMVIANRFSHLTAKNIPWIRSFLNRFAASVVSFFLNYKADDLTCGFRAHNRETLLRFNLTNVNFTYTQETLIDAIGKNLKLKWVPIQVTYFANRKPKITKSIFKFVNNGFKIIIKAVRDVRPMKFFGIPALFLILTSMGFFIYFISLYFQDFKITAHRNYLLVGITLLLVGIQFLVFALIADMIKSNRNLIEEQMYLLKSGKYKK